MASRHPGNASIERYHRSISLYVLTGIPSGPAAGSQAANAKSARESLSSRIQVRPLRWAFKIAANS